MRTWREFAQTTISFVRALSACSVLHHTGDLSPFPDIAVAKSLANGILAGQELPRERLIHQHNGWCVFVVALIQIATSHQPGLHGPQVAGSDLVHVCAGGVSRARLRLAFQKDRAIG